MIIFLLKGSVGTLTYPRSQTDQFKAH